MTQTLYLDNLRVGEVGPVSLQAGPGEILCLSGSSGAGKSRLLRAVADLESHEGRVLLGGTAASDIPASEWRRRVMLVPSESRWWHDHVREHCGPEQPEDLKALGFESSVLDWPVSRLSSGEKQRLALYRALTLEPQALLLDEPTANLDATNRDQVEQWLLERIREGGRPTLWVAHDPEQIQRVASAHYRIHGHRLEQV
mgnify:CR=1 FL=1